MKSNDMTRRLVIVSVCLLGGALFLSRASRSEAVPIKAPLSELPWTIGDWQGRPAPDLTPDVLEVLGVDEYVNRAYVRRGVPAGLYVGYYESQRQGDTMHSPLNCLPGAGWTPTRQARITVAVDTERGPRQIEVNSVVIAKGLDRQAVLYWYQGQGRVVASEYWGKIYLVLDAIRLNRSDGAMVRVIVPVEGQGGADAEEAAEGLAVGFVQALFPVLSRHLPA